MANDNSKNKPDVHVFIQGDADNAPLIKVGAGWNHRTGGGLTVKLDALPTNGTLVLYPPRADSN